MQKPGYKTSEFWLVLAFQLVSALVASGAVPTEHWILKVAALALSALSALGYSADRSKLKAAQPTDPPPQG